MTTCIVSNDPHFILWLQEFPIRRPAGRRIFLVHIDIFVVGGDVGVVVAAPFVVVVPVVGIIAKAGFHGHNGRIGTKSLF